MGELPPLMRDQRKTDADHLKLLGIFHFIGAALALLGILFLLAHFALMHAVFTNPNLFKVPNQQNQQPPPEAIFDIMKWFYLAFGLWFLICGTINLISGYCLLKRKNRIFSLVVAGINCIHIPLGTTLGAFTMVVLLRDSVRDLYQE
jgi:hypothetical protein